MNKKKYGQHFLKNNDLCKKITRQLTFEGYNQLIEIGPGKGALTSFLPFDNLTLIEIDLDCVEYLKMKFPKLKEAIINEDILKINNSFWQKKKLGVIGNFPYNISSQIIFKILENKNSVIEVVGMFQKEVAERICAKHGSKKYGITSVLTQVYYNTEYLFEISNEEFYPKPKVTSAIIRLKKKKNNSLIFIEKNLRKVVKTAFNQRRKKIKNSLREINFNLEKENNIFDKRPEQLNIEDFIFLSKNINDEV